MKRSILVLTFRSHVRKRIHVRRRIHVKRSLLVLTFRSVLQAERALAPHKKALCSRQEGAAGHLQKIKIRNEALC